MSVKSNSSKKIVSKKASPDPYVNHNVHTIQNVSREEAPIDEENDDMISEVISSSEARSKIMKESLISEPTISVHN